MIIISKVIEFCDYNKDNWKFYRDYAEEKEFITIYSSKLEGHKSVTLFIEDITNIVIESNCLVICVSNKIIICIGGDTESLSIDTTDIYNPLIR